MCLCGTTARANRVTPLLFHHRHCNLVHMPFTDEDSRRWAKENIARICAEQGITVEIKDPVLLGRLADGLRVGKQRYDAVRIKEATAPLHRSNRHLPQVDPQPALLLAESQ